MKNFTIISILSVILSLSISVFGQQKSNVVPNYSEKDNTLILTLLYLETNRKFREKEGEFDWLLFQPKAQKELAKFKTGKASYLVKLANISKDSDFKEFLFYSARNSLNAAKFHEKWAKVCESDCSNLSRQYRNEYNDAHDVGVKGNWTNQSSIIKRKMLDRYKIDFFKVDSVEKALLPSVFSTDKSTKNNSLDYYKNFRPDMTYFAYSKSQLLNDYLSKMNVDPILIKYFDVDFLYNLALYANDYSIEALPLITETLLTGRAKDPITNFLASTLSDYIEYKLKTDKTQRRLEVFKEITQVLQVITKEVESEIKELKKLEEFADSYYADLQKDYFDNKYDAKFYLAVKSIIPNVRFEREQFQNYLLTEINISSSVQQSIQDKNKVNLSTTQKKLLDIINSFRKANNLELINPE